MACEKEAKVDAVSYSMLGAAVGCRKGEDYQESDSIDYSRLLD